MKALAAAFREWVWLIGICGVVAAFAAAVVSFLVPPVYEADAVLLVPDQPSLQVTYAKLADDPSVLGPVLDHLKLLNRRRYPMTQSITRENLARLVSARAEPGSNIVVVTAVDSTPGVAREIDNAVVTTLAAKAKAPASGAPAVGAVTIVAMATTPQQARAPSLPLNAVAGLFLGLVAGTVLALALELLGVSATEDLRS